jgi:hypothetical protein
MNLNTLRLKSTNRTTRIMILIKNSFLKKLLILCCIAIGIASCGTEKETAKALSDAPVFTLVFLDKTLSLNVDKQYVNEKYRQALTDIVENNMKNKGDKLEVYFIHENTSKARALSLSVHSIKDNLDGKNATDIEAIETTFQLSLQREKNIFLRQILGKLAQQNTSLSNQHTDIWASLPVIAKANESGADVRVYYFSDMVESVRGSDRRDFHTRPPASDREAEEDARADVKKLDQYIIGSPVVTIVSPFEATASSKENNPHVTHYWQILFQELGGVQLEEL